jgi:hypothetical protein
MAFDGKLLSGVTDYFAKRSGIIFTGLNNSSSPTR